jgi:hypothetical protein
MGAFLILFLEFAMNELCEWNMGSDGIMWRNEITTGKIPQQNWIDVTELMNKDNCTMPLMNNNAYWQRQIPCAVTFDQSPHFVQLPIVFNECVSPCDAPYLFMWLCETSNPTEPLQCSCHKEIFKHPALPNAGRSRSVKIACGINNQRIPFMLCCTRKCFPSVGANGFGITIVKYVPGEGVRWNFVSGAFRGSIHTNPNAVKRRQRSPPSSQESSFSESERIDELYDQIDDLSTRLNDIAKEFAHFREKFRHK